MAEQRQRVVVTGVGPVSAIGVGRCAFADALLSGTDGVGPITLFDPEPCRAGLAAEVRGFDVNDFLETEKTYLDPASEFALGAMQLALDDAGIDRPAAAADSAALLLGSAWGSLNTMDVFFDDFLRKGPRFVKPFLFPHAYANTAISLVAIEYGLTGYHMNFAAGAVSSACALMDAYDRIRRGADSMALAGGYEALALPALAGYERVGLLSPGDDGEEHCAPYDRSRNGFILGEGGGVVVLEAGERARARGARVYGEIAGAAALGDSSVSCPGGGEGIAACMRQAVRSAGLEIDAVDCVLGAANGSSALDANEMTAIHGVFGARVRVASIKAQLGETLGASGVLQSIAALATIMHGRVPATLHLAAPDPCLDLRFAEGSGAEVGTGTVLVNTIDPGGSMVSLVLRGERIDA